MTEMSPTLKRVLESAALLQEVVSDAVLVGGSVAALHAGHRDSSHHDHVLTDLVERYGSVLEVVETTEGWGNVDASPKDDVWTWPYEALITVIDRGLVAD